MSSSKLTRRELLKLMSTASAGGVIGSSLPIYKSFAQSSSAPMRLLIIPKYYGWTTRVEFGDEIATADASASFGFSLPDYMSDLNPFKEHLTIVENMRGTYWSNAHDISYANILTNACVEGEASSAQLQYNEPMGASFDWVLGQRLNKSVARIDLGIGRGAPICFDDKFLRQPMFTTVESFYDKVVGPILKYQVGASSEDLQLRAINEELFNLLGRSTDRIAKLLTGTGNEANKLANFKRSLEKANPNNGIVKSTLASITDPGRLENANLNGLDRISQALKIIKCSFMADTKRVAVMSIPGDPPYDQMVWTDKEGNPQTGMGKINEEWMALGNPSAATNFHHLVSHYTRIDPSTGQFRSDINAQRCMNASLKLYFKKIADFVQDLSTTLDVDGHPMIENTCIMLTSEVSTGTHDTRRQPIILIGGRSAGNYTSGKILRGPVVPGTSSGLKTQTRGGRIEDSILVNNSLLVSLRTQGDLFVPLARAMGVQINSFGFETRNSTPFIL